MASANLDFGPGSLPAEDTDLASQLALWIVFPCNGLSTAGAVRLVQWARGRGFYCRGSGGNPDYLQWIANGTDSRH